MQDFSFNLENLTDQGVLEADLYVLQYDKSGFPVSVSPYDTYCVNGRTAGGNTNLSIGESRAFSSGLFCEADTENCKAILTRIKLQDGTEWTNPYQYEWILVNNKSYSEGTNESAFGEIQGELETEEEASEPLNPDLPSDVMSKIAGIFKNISVTDETQYLYVNGDKVQLEVSIDGNPASLVEYTYKVMPNTFSSDEGAVGIGAGDEIEYIIHPFDDSTIMVVAPEGSGSAKFSGGYQRVSDEPAASK